MIAVMADDFTGAAELAGISLRYGLKVALFADEPAATDAEVVIVSTNSRSLNKAAALQKTEHILRQLIQSNPSFIYKKIDSVLRGYVLDELKLQVQLMQNTKAFILPANPSLGRTISNGIYYVEGKPIGETGFATDPEFPVSNSVVKSILKDDGIKVLKPKEALPENGIIVGEAENETDVQAWAEKLDETFVLAGAGDFYTALLNKQNQQVQQKAWQIAGNLLYVSGTAYDRSVNDIAQAHKQGQPVVYITREMIETSTITTEWLTQFTTLMQPKKKAILAFNPDQIPAQASAVHLRNIMAKAVKAVLKQHPINEMFIEGGATATAILNELNINHLTPINELKRGVVRMKINQTYITVKPGSYELPIELKEQFGSSYAH
ncbi:MAG: four-carbon acid sugar kinase family protein [Sphingobacteriaceae bacterium]